LLARTHRWLFWSLLLLLPQNSASFGAQHQRARHAFFSAHAAAFCASLNAAVGSPVGGPVGSPFGPALARARSAAFRIAGAGAFVCALAPTHASAHRRARACAH